MLCSGKTCRNSWIGRESGAPRLTHQLQLRTLYSMPITIESGPTSASTDDIAPIGTRRRSPGRDSRAIHARSALLPNENRKQDAKWTPATDVKLFEVPHADAFIFATHQTIRSDSPVSASSPSSRPSSQFSWQPYPWATGTRTSHSTESTSRRDGHSLLRSFGHSWNWPTEDCLADLDKCTHNNESSRPLKESSSVIQSARLVLC